MKIMLFLILTSLLVALGFLFVFFWAAKDGQFDDDYTPAVRILFEDKTTETTGSQIVNSQPSAATLNTKP